MSRSICVVTGSRADYGLLRWVMEDIEAAEDLTLQIVASGMHLSPRFGQTLDAIEADGLTVDWEVEMLLASDTPSGVTKSIGMGIIGFADAFERLKPEIVVILGDRFEALAAAVAAIVARIPIAHIHGGEVTEGALDDAFRHAITKMASLHFVAAEPYRRRVVQLGESEETVFMVGGMGLDSIERLKLLDRPELEESLGCQLGTKSLLVTFHPVTLEAESSLAQLGELLAALKERGDTRLIFTLPNADPGGHSHAGLIEEFARSNSNALVVTSLGQQRYLSCLREVDGVVGNSSSGLLEAPSLGTGTVDIGSRQLGRLRAPSVLSSNPLEGEISAAIDRLYSPDFREIVKDRVSPYGSAGASRKIVALLQGVSLTEIKAKRFVDLPWIAEE